MKALNDYKIRRGVNMEFYTKLVIREQLESFSEAIKEELLRLLTGYIPAKDIIQMVSDITEEVYIKGRYVAQLQVTDDYETAKRLVTLLDTSWTMIRSEDAEYEEVLETGQILFGDAKLGMLNEKEKFINGSCNSYKSEETEAEFNQQSTLVTFIKREKRSNVSEEIDREARVVVYIPQ